MTIIARAKGRVPGCAAGSETRRKPGYKLFFLSFKSYDIWRYLLRLTVTLELRVQVGFRAEFKIRAGFRVQNQIFSSLHMLSEIFAYS